MVSADSSLRPVGLSRGFRNCSRGAGPGGPPASHHGLILRSGQRLPNFGPALLDGPADVLQQQWFTPDEFLDVLAIDLQHGDLAKGARGCRDRLSGEGGLAEEIALVQGTDGYQRTVVTGCDQPHLPVDDESHTLRHLAGELQRLVGTVTSDAGMGEKLLLVGLAEPQRRRDDA